jgi:hypothetical protein
MASPGGVAVCYNIDKYNVQHVALDAGSLWARCRSLVLQALHCSASYWSYKAAIRRRWAVGPWLALRSNVMSCRFDTPRWSPPTPPG